MMEKNERTVADFNYQHGELDGSKKLFDNFKRSAREMILI